jgi:acetylornithine deacetylase/succinyl-diaminopimelate desuccinylase-like protein
MVAVCAMLEAARSQSENNALKNDIYFLFTDGEENGLLGANKFVAAHPELKNKIDMVVNLEARGNSGGLLLFETSPQAYRNMKTVIKSGARPIGMSWAAAVYAMMPNYTDLTVFLDHGYSGVNFAAIEGPEHYHKPTDNFENLDTSTAWQYIHTTLAIADYAANNTLDELQKPSQDAVYFPLLPGVLVLMNGLSSYIVCAASCVLALAFVTVQAKKRRLKVSFSTVLLGLLVLLSIGSAVWFAAGAYLFYIPLLVMVISKLTKKWTIANMLSHVFGGVIALLIWVPGIFLLWVSMIQPMM